LAEHEIPSALPEATVLSTTSLPERTGYVSINFVAAPEASTWAMTLMGFAGLGWLARLRKRRLTPA
jgi:hypothetical protein